MNATLPQTYFKMVKAFPLTSIRDYAHLAEAQAVLDDLLAQDLDEGGEAYLDALSDLVEVFETQHEPKNDVTGGEVLRELLNANRLSQGALARATGIAQSTISALINGDRPFTLAHAKKLGEHFCVSASAFLPI